MSRRASSSPPPPLDITAAIMKQMGIKPEAAADTNAIPATAAPAAPGRR